MFLTSVIYVAVVALLYYWFVGLLSIIALATI